MTHLVEKSLLEQVTYNSSAMQDVRKEVDPLVHSAVPILFWGETGSGAAFYARAINAESREGAFLRFSLMSLDGDLAKQAFYGKDQQQGWLEQADKGTFLVRELHEVPLDVQQFLLHLLKIQSVDGRLEFFRIGEAQQLEKNVRFIYTVSGNPDALIHRELLSQELVDFIRKQGKIIELPPLRKRKEDVIDIIKNFFDSLNQEREHRITFIDKKAQQLLTDYYWPGNIDELKQVISGIFHQYPDIPTISEEHIPQHISHPKKFEYRHSITLKDDERFPGKILSKTFRVESTLHDKSTHRINTSEIIAVKRVEDPTFTPPKLKHFEFDLKDGSHIIGHLLDKTIKVGTSFNPSRRIDIQDLESIKLL